MNLPEQQAITGPKSPYGRVFIEILMDKNLSEHAKLCYAVMTSFGQGITWASIPTIADRMSVGETTARAAQRELEADQWIVRGEAVMGSTIHWKMLAPFERTILKSKGGSPAEGARPARGGGSPSEGEGLAQQRGVVRLPNPKQEPKHEPKNDTKHENVVPTSSPQEKEAPAGKEPQTTKKTITGLTNSPLGLKFKAAYDSCGIGSYFFNDKDVAVIDQALALGLSDAQLDTSLEAFFHPTSWHRLNGADRFVNFVKQAQRYARTAFAGVRGTTEDLSRYYEPWDHRHPSFKPADPIKEQQKLNWELTHGPWTPKPDFKPKGQ